MWSGIGGWDGSDLGQVGTVWGEPGWPAGKAFWEVVPSSSNQGNGPHQMSLTPTYGQDVVAETSRITNGYEFFIYNATNGNSDTVTTTSLSNPGQYNYYSGYSAEAIVENPNVPVSILDGFTNLGTTSFLAAYANNTLNESYNAFSPATGFNEPGRHGLWLTSNGAPSGTLMEQPSGIGSFGSFTDQYMNCD